MSESGSSSGPHTSAATTAGAPVHSCVTADPAALGERPGDSIGPYKLLQLIGEGGFGSVFMAEQMAPVHRTVALKIIKLGMDTRQVIARFEAERQALALMDHPCIARVFDAGATQNGRPYFVMELVKGAPITEYCDSNNLSISDRLNLFAQVCHAIQHAHTKGVIHRDIKPTNVLVSTRDGKASAKVIDFGIAKATSSKLTEKTLFTEHKQFIGTPEYMSPEQAEGSLDIDTRTDVYSLGVLLYELLTGTTPFSSRELRSAAMGEIQRIIREIDPPKPSTRLTETLQTKPGIAAMRRSEPGRVSSLLRGELDWIVMKAMDKDRQRRYDTASGLADDIDRHLSGRAVVAAPPSRSYLARKFIARNRGAVIAASLVTGALVLGIVGTAIGLVNATRQRELAEKARTAEAAQRELAETRLQESQAVVTFLDDMLGAADPLAQGKDVMVRSVLDRAAGSISTEFASRPLVAARLHSTIGKTYLNLGEFTKAEEHLREAYAIDRRELGEDDPDTCRARNALGLVLVERATMPEAEQLMTAALERHERLFGRRHEITLETMDCLSQVYLRLEQREKSLALAQEVLDIRRQMHGTSDLGTVGAMNTVALLHADLERFEEAEKLFETAMALEDAANGRDHPLSLEIRANFGWVEYAAAMRVKQSDPDLYKARIARARSLDEETLEARTRILGEDHPDTLTMMNNLGAVYRELGMYDEADKLALKDIEVSVRMLGEAHPDTITSIANMGNSLRTRHRFEEAVVYLDRALKNARQALPKDADGLAFILGWYGSTLSMLGRHSEGARMLEEAHGIITRTMGDDHPIARQMSLDLERVYLAWDKSEPGKGHAETAAIWKKKGPEQKTPGAEAAAPPQ